MDNEPGAPTVLADGPVLPSNEKASGMAWAALILGILGLCCCGCLTGVPALIIGWIEKGKIERGESAPAGKGFAWAGIVLGVVSLLLFCLQLIWIFFLGGMDVIQQMQ